MSVAEPPFALDNSCTVVHDNTLYSYSPQGFLALPLEEDAKWKKLDSGESVTGASCVGTNPPDASQAGFFVIGGKTDKADYSGVQKYTFATKKWSTVPVSGPDMKNRQYHSTAYLRGEDSIVIYAGRQDGSKTISQNTFMIGASEPYIFRSFPSTVPAAISPVLLPWSDGDVAYIGPTTGGNVYLFNPHVMWRDIGTSMATPFPADSSSIKAALINGDDGSKSLYTFNLNQSPNTAQRMVIQGAGGKPVTGAAPVADKPSKGGKQRRALTMDNWPAYNSTLAPKTARSDYSLAQGPDGMIVFSGGVAKNSKAPVAIFNANKNGWVDANVLLGDGTQKIMDTSSTSTVASSTTTSSSITSSTLSTVMSTTEASTTAEPSSTSIAGAGVAHHGPSSNAILGVTLGSIAAFLAMLGLILICLRRHKRRRNRVGDDDMNADEKDTVAFAKSTQPSATPAQYRGHNPQLSQESYSSVAILMGKMGRTGSNAGRNGDSFRDSIDSVHKQFKSTISKPIPQTNDNPMLQGHDDKGVAFAPSVAEPRPRNGPTATQDGTRRSSGWNKYWSGGSALQILGYGNGKRNTATSEQSSRYSEAPSNNNNPRVTQDSATVPPLNFEGRPAVNSVISGSPVVSQYTSKVPDGMSGTIEDRPVSPVSSGYSSGIPESINDAWDPTDMDKPWGSERAPSSAYAPSVQYGTSLGPSNGASAPTSGVSNQPQLAMASTSSDMSWLNLGDQSRKK